VLRICRSSRRENEKHGNYSNGAPPEVGSRRFVEAFPAPLGHQRFDSGGGLRGAFYVKVKFVQ
jgi:hypothetical protein